MAAPITAVKTIGSIQPANTSIAEILAIRVIICAAQFALTPDIREKPDRPTWCTNNNRCAGDRLWPILLKNSGVAYWSNC
jgi:hypothetical protein